MVDLLYKDVLWGFSNPRKNLGEIWSIITGDGIAPVEFTLEGPTPEKGKTYSDDEYRRIMHFRWEAMRDKIRSATVYVLTDELTAIVSEMSKMNPNDILKMMRQAYPPNDCMWVEWNEKVRHQHLATDPRSGVNADTSTVSSRCAIFIEPSKKFENHWFTSSWWRMAPPHHLVVSPIGKVWSPLGLDPELNTDIDDGFLPTSVHDWGSQYISETNRTTGKNWNKSLTRMKQYAAPRCAEPWLDDLVVRIDNLAAGIEGGKFPERESAIIKAWGAQIEAFAMDTMGDLRLMVCILTALNTHKKYVKAGQAHAIKGVSHGKVLPKFEYRVLDIVAPSISPLTIPRIIKSAGAATRKRWHEVRGHWRHYSRNGKTWKVWIKPHERGDKNIGVLVKDYIASPDGKSTDAEKDDVREAHRSTN